VILTSEKIEKIQMKLSLLGMQNDDNGQKITINNKRHLIGQ